MIAVLLVYTESFYLQKEAKLQKNRVASSVPTLARSGKFSSESCNLTFYLVSTGSHYNNFQQSNLGYTFFRVFHEYDLTNCNTRITIVTQYT